MTIGNFKGFEGKHCESSATGCLLRHAGMDMSEPMIFGIGQGLGFIYWKMGTSNLPFVGGRSKPFDLTKMLCGNLGIPLYAVETGSKKKAWNNVVESIDHGLPIGLQLDCYHLEHFKQAFHFAGHFLCVYGYSDDNVVVMDTGGRYEVGRENLEKARFERGPMAAKARSWTLRKTKKAPELRDVIPIAVGAVAREFLNPPIRNLGVSGILKMSQELPSWIRMAENPEADLADAAYLMENGGTGGALFRNLYRDFLRECLEYLPGSGSLRRAAEGYAASARYWTEIAALIAEESRSGDGIRLTKASGLCLKAAEAERTAMEELMRVGDSQKPIAAAALQNAE